MRVDPFTYLSHTDTEIKGFFGQYRWLSNMEPCSVWYEGLEYKSTENAYQAAKFENNDDRVEFQSCNAYDAKKLGKQVILNTNTWNQRKVGIMAELVMQKFLRNSVLRQNLLNTGSKYLEETNAWKDTFWGVDYKTGIGANVLGKLLMSVRDYLKIVTEYEKY